MDNLLYNNVDTVSIMVCVWYIKSNKVVICNIVIVVNVVDIGVREELKEMRTMMNEMKIKEEQTRSETKKKEEATRKREEATRKREKAIRKREEATKKQYDDKLKILTDEQKQYHEQIKNLTTKMELIQSQQLVPVMVVKEEKKVTKVFNPRTCTKRTCTRIVTETFGSGKFKKQCRRCIILA